MKVGLTTDDALCGDAAAVQWKTTGVGRYTQELYRGLTAEGVSVGLIYATAPSVPLGEAMKHVLAMPRAVLREASRFDLIHASSPITALAFAAIRKPKVVTYHDLVPLLCTNASSAFHTRLFAPVFLRVGMLADRIIAISSQTKEEMVTHLGLPADKIAVVSYGISQMFRPMRELSRGQNVVGYVGTLDRRKAVDCLIRAISLFKDRYPGTPIKLVICGGKSQQYGALVKLASDLTVAQDLEFRGVVVGEELVKAYNSFDVFVHPSEWEGFGFPILEAQRCGVPVIIRDDAHIPPEVSKCCLKAGSEKDMADKVYELLTNAILRQSTIEEGLEYSQQFTWERTVRQTVEVYEQILS
ncbi:glycosyltransferase family 4 protein [Candidatus Bathyarchaeota archaeon]|nr:glycosyltransferase family 4 protein [Candidatus Bathyarchaeota archaeon]